jgi:catechol 2,3-dioxygenase-like lactoylglutathione lyase family enzyme
MSDAKPIVAIRQLWPLLFVEQIERSVAFYRDKLGFALREHADSDGRMYWCRMERGGASIMLEQSSEGEIAPGEPPARGVVFYFLCDDADLMHAELAARGLTVDRPQVAFYGMKQLFVPEPDGYAICFESPVPPA